MKNLLIKPINEIGKVLDIAPETVGWNYVGFKVYKLKTGGKVFENTARDEAIIVFLEGYGAARTDSEGVIKLNSANTSILSRNSLSRFAHNTRIMIDIKKKIKYLLLTSDIMFANNYSLDNIQTSLSTALNNLLQGYVSRNVIKSFYVKLNTGQTQAEKEDALDSILRSKIVLSLFGAPGENVETMQLNDILNTTQNNLTETAKLDILLPVI